MTLYSLDDRHDARSRHRWLNRFQTLLLVLTLLKVVRPDLSTTPGPEQPFGVKSL